MIPFQVIILPLFFWIFSRYLLRYLWNYVIEIEYIAPAKPPVAGLILPLMCNKRHKKAESLSSR